MRRRRACRRRGRLRPRRRCGRPACARRRAAIATRRAEAHAAAVCEAQAGLRRSRGAPTSSGARARRVAILSRSAAACASASARRFFSTSASISVEPALGDEVRMRAHRPVGQLRQVVRFLDEGAAHRGQYPAVSATGRRGSEAPKSAPSSRRMIVWVEPIVAFTTDLVPHRLEKLQRVGAEALPRRGARPAATGGACAAPRSPPRRSCRGRSRS